MMRLAFPFLWRELCRPLRNTACQLASLAVIPAERTLLAYSGRPEENDCVFDLLVLKVRKRPKIFRQNAERAGVWALQEGLFPVGKRLAERVDVSARRGAVIVALGQTPILASASLEHSSASCRLVKFGRCRAATYSLFYRKRRKNSVMLRLSISRKRAKEASTTATRGRIGFACRPRLPRALPVLACKRARSRASCRKREPNSTSSISASWVPAAFLERCIPHTPCPIWPPTSRLRACDSSSWKTKARSSRSRRRFTIAASHYLSTSFSCWMAPQAFSRSAA